VTLGDRVDTHWVVEGGLEEGQNVIVEGLQKVRPGVLVQATGLTRDEG
jgi:membrane fusion protein (multidrug efflux system)